MGAESKRHSDLGKTIRRGLPYKSGVSNGLPVWRTESPHSTAEPAHHALNELLEQFDVLRRAAQEVETLAFRQYADWMHLHEKAMVDPFGTEAQAQDFARSVSSLLTIALGVDSTIEVIGDSSPAKERP